jgi:hypothetical protein
MNDYFENIKFAEIPDIETAQVYSSTDTATKDKVLTVRVEEGFYNLLEALAEKMNTGSISQTARAILSMFLIPQVYKFELENLKPEKLSEFLNEKQQAGEPVSFDRFMRFIEKLETYNAFLNEAEEKSKVSMQFIQQEKQKVEKTVSMLKQVQETWKEIFMENE